MPAGGDHNEDAGGADLLLDRLAGRLPAEVVRGLRALAAEQLAAVLPALLQAVEVQIEPLTPADAAAALASPERFGFLPRDVAAELSPASAALWNQGLGPVALGAFASDGGGDAARQLAGLVVARVDAAAGSPCAAAAGALAASAPAAAAPLLLPALQGALGAGPEPAAVASVALLGVDFAFRRQGVGAALLGAVEAVVAATAGAAAAAASAGGGGGGSGRAARAGGAVALLAPEPAEEEAEAGSGAARFYAGRGYGRAGGAALEEALRDEGAEEGDEEGNGAAAAAAAATGSEQRARQQRRRRRFVLRVKRVEVEEGAGGGASPAPAPPKRRRAPKRAGKGFSAAAALAGAAAAATTPARGGGGRGALGAAAAAAVARPARSGLLVPRPRFRCLAARALSAAAGRRLFCGV